MTTNTNSEIKPQYLPVPKMIAARLYSKEGGEAYSEGNPFAHAFNKAINNQKKKN